MKIIKRNGSEAVFDISKIITAVTKANNADSADCFFRRRKLRENEPRHVCRGNSGSRRK